MTNFIDYNEKGVSVMTKIPQLSMNSFWSKINQPSTVNNINALLPQDNQLANFTQSFKVLQRWSIQDAQSQQQYKKNVAQFSDSVKNINSSAKALTSSTAFDNKGITGSADGAITGIAKASAKVAQYNVSVSKVATTQKNESSKLNTNGYGTLAAGSYTFGIKSGSSEEKQMSVTIKATDNNKQVLAKFASAINSSGGGVIAEVKTKDNTQYLSVVSKDTGAVNSFTMRDVKGNGLSTLEVGNKEQAIDAAYMIDGISYKSASNKVSLGNGNVTLQWNKTTTSTEKITVGKDSSSIVAETRKLVKSYNELHNVLSNSDNVTSRGAMALQGMEAIAKGVGTGGFASIGISMDRSTGELQLDEKKLATGVDANPDRVKTLISGTGGLAKRMEVIGNELANDSATSYLKSPANVYDYSSQFASNSWMAQQNSLIQGLFFDMTV